MLGPGWNESAFTFYDLPGATGLRDALARFEGGRLVVDIVDMPIKCPVAPIEFVFLADWYLRQRGIREQTTLTLATPLDGCFTKPIASKHLTYLLAQKGVELSVEFSAGSVDGERGVLASYDGRELPFDLLGGDPAARRPGLRRALRGLGDALGFVPTDPGTLQAKTAENVFALGDATDVPTSKAGSVAHFEGEVLTENLASFLAGRPLAGALRRPRELLRRDRIPQGDADRLQLRHRAGAGTFPDGGGPLPLLRESRANHLGKLAFQWLYWHALLPGREMPVVGPAMPTPASTFAGSGVKEEHAMTTTLIADRTVDVDAEGFLTDPGQWTRRSRRRSRARPASRSSPTGTGSSSASCASAT